MIRVLVIIVVNGVLLKLWYMHNIYMTAINFPNFCYVFFFFFFTIQLKTATVKPCLCRQWNYSLAVHISQLFEVMDQTQCSILDQRTIFYSHLSQARVH